MLFQNLTKLEVLSLFGVDISSKIPTNMSSSLRYLDLRFTNLLGDFPNSLFLLPNLESLGLSYNFHLSGSLPKFNWSSNRTLTELDLSNTFVSGGLPSSLGSLKALKILRLSSCNLVGPIPESISNLSHITELDLSNNHLKSKIPDNFSNLQKIKRLALDFNTIISPFPSSLVNLTQLVVLRLQGTLLAGPLPLTANGLQNLEEVYLNHNSLNGSIPSWMAGLPSLTTLILDNNCFSGPIPDFKTSSLDHLELSGNQLDGPIPQSLRYLTLFGLSLESNNLSGEVAAEMFSNMIDLSYLKLSHSGLSWSSNRDDINITLPFLSYLALGFCRVKEFPNFLMNSKQVHNLDLSENKIQGMLPVWFGGWSSLQLLNLSHNYLVSLDHLPWQTMTIVDLQSNSLTGPLPSSLCKPNHLNLLDLSHNNLSAEIPSCLFIAESLRVLELRGNNFHGPIPDIFTGCEHKSLNHIGLSKNCLDGSLPTSVINCTSLRVLDLGNNKIHDTFPRGLEKLQELEVLIFKSNRFYGPIVAFDAKIPFPNLRIIDLSGNAFTDTLPTKILKGFRPMKNRDMRKSEREYMEQVIDSGSLGRFYDDSVIKNKETEFQKVLKIFTAIDLSRNKFEGEIPKFVGNLNSLLLLNLSHNNLTGYIPVEMRNMSTLEALNLSFNQLIGTIPQELTSLTFLEVLNLSFNHLAGPIPHGNQFNTFSIDSYVGNQDLCGFPLSNECGEKGKSPELSVEQEEDESSFLSEMTWESVAMGYGCGLICGFSILYLIYRFERPRWFIDFFASITPPPRRGTIRGQRRSNFQRRRH